MADDDVTFYYRQGWKEGEQNERGRIIAELRDMIENPDSYDGLHPLDVIEHILYSILKASDQNAKS